MKFKRFLTILAAIFTVALVKAQSSFPQPVMNSPKDGGILRGLNMNEMETSFVLSVNKLDEKKKAKLNQVASNYRSKNRSVTTDIGKSMLAGGVASIVNVIATEIINLTQIRSKQRKAWQEMRNKECSFIDSLQSVNGQSDFYGRQ